MIVNFLRESSHLEFIVHTKNPSVVDCSISHWYMRTSELCAKSNYMLMLYMIYPKIYTHICSMYVL